MPTTLDFEKLKEATKQLQSKKRLLKLASVNKDLKPYKEKIHIFFDALNKDVLKAEFENKESIEILNSFLKKTREVFMETFGE